ncbi:helix-turn-helix domain-containing protein [Sphaerimonospora mesophila]|uniref:helix-turn-helix domain-containing protein n=1 Tax=Sphaerimonospora mesophila TaxID=37483 RepID=UPI0009FB2EFA
MTLAISTDRLRGSGPWSSVGPLTPEDREETSRCLAVGLSNKEISGHIDRNESVICREIARNGGRERYRAHAAERRAEEDVAAQKRGNWTATRPCMGEFCPDCG